MTVVNGRGVREVRKPPRASGSHQACLQTLMSRLRLTIPACVSIVAILLFAPGTRSLLVTSFSTARMTPSLHLIPIAVLRRERGTPGGTRNVTVSSSASGGAAVKVRWAKTKTAYPEFSTALFAYSSCVVCECNVSTMLPPSGTAAASHLEQPSVWRVGAARTTKEQRSGRVSEKRWP